jgi:hypothetical protein
LKKPFICIISGTIILLLLFLIQLNPAMAQSELSDSQIQARLQVVQDMLEQGTSNADVWWNGWLIGYSAATLGQGAVYLTSEDKSIRQDMALGAATTLLGAMGQIMTPKVHRSAMHESAGTSESTPAQRAAKLLEAEKLLEENAAQEKAGRSWKIHAITGVVNLGSGLVVWLGFKRNIWEGIGNFALNTVVTEAQIWTQPTRAVKNYDHYIKEYQTGEKLNARRMETSWSMALYPGGFAIQIVF